VERQRSLAVYVDLRTVLALRQLMLGQSAVLDCAVSAAVAGAGRRVRRRVPPDRVRLQRRRAAQVAGIGRVRGIPGWHEVDRGQVERMRVDFPSVDAVALRLDGVAPRAANLAEVYALIGHRPG
jgi:hypothetical protein